MFFFQICNKKSFKTRPNSLYRGETSIYSLIQQGVTRERPNLASRLGSSIRAPLALVVLLLMDRRCNGGVKVTEAAKDVAP